MKLATCGSIRVLGVLFVSATFSLVHAFDISWTNTAGGAFQTPANWDPNQVPGVNDKAVFNLDEIYQVTFAGNETNAQMQAIQGTVTMDLAGNTYRVTTETDGFNVGATAAVVTNIVTGTGRLETAGFRVGNTTAGGRKWLVISGAGTVWTNSSESVDNTTVGYLGHGGLRIEDGAEAHLRGLTLNRTSGSSEVIVTGSNSLMRTEHHAYLGYGNGLTGSMLIENGGQWIADGRILYDRGTFDLTVDGPTSRIEARDVLRVGDGSTGTRTDRNATLTLRNGAELNHTTTLTFRPFLVGYLDYNATVTVESTGTLTTTASAIDVGTGASDWDSTRTGLIVVRDLGSSFEHTGSTVNLGLGNKGLGILQVQTGGVFRTVGNILVATTSSATGRVEVAGSQAVLQANNLYVGGIATEARGDGRLLAAAGGSVTVTNDLVVWGTGELALEAGTVATGALDMQDGAVFAVTLFDAQKNPAGTDSMLTVGSGSEGDAALGEVTLNLTLGAGYTPTVGDTFNLALVHGDLTGTLGDLAERTWSEQGYAWEISHLPGSTLIQLEVIPEPSALVLLLGAIGLLGLVRRRRGQ